MRIGIITVYNAVNYGSYLQAYCLQKVLNDIGYDDVVMLRVSSLLYEKWRFTSLFTYNPHKIQFKMRLAKGYFKLWKNFRVQSPKKPIDLLIVGSDEMWEVNNITMTPKPEFFGIGVNAKKKITYAVSSNTTKSSDTKSYEFIAEGIKEFSAISVRDQSTYDAYASMFDGNISINIDPTLLVDLNAISDCSIRRDNFILCYTYTFQDYMIEAAKKLAYETGKKLIVVGQNFAWADEQIAANAFEFLGLIKQADFVITDTFHGTVLSIGLNKEFVTFAYKEKVHRVLEQMNLLDRDATREKNLNKYYDKKIDFQTVNLFIKQQREKSIEYLKNNLQL